ncbi:hypothetical protein SKAU_G00385090 [Synaphobranchus kaupii]|uniref:Uncharacterized protein n=1 Tax=Synaphobranchus kaupii TaxID=118154 RepID=A0A9Q1IF24_SYNKA|nr:hypothetical protein SKAU_G00385090 [Synaphobranchus kaupii]
MRRLSHVALGPVGSALAGIVSSQPEGNHNFISKCQRLELQLSQADGSKQDSTIVAAAERKKLGYVADSGHRQQWEERGPFTFQEKLLLPRYSAPQQVPFPDQRQWQTMK